MLPRTRPGTRRTAVALLTVAVAVLAAMLGPGAPAPAAAAEITNAATMITETPAVADPHKPRGRVVRRIGLSTPLNDDDLFMPVLDRRLVKGREWLKVRIFGRPNGMTGWVPADAAIVRPLPWSLEVDLSARRLTVRRAGTVVRSVSVVVGAPSTPTPTGDFFIVERTRLRADWSPRGWALSTSAFSNVLRHFEGGDGQVAIHARGRLWESLGTASSHGCVRVADPVAAWLAARIPNGTPLQIRR